MTAFIVIAGILVIGALAFVVVPLLRREPARGVSRDAINVGSTREPSFGRNRVGKPIRMCGARGQGWIAFVYRCCSGTSP